MFMYLLAQKHGVKMAEAFTESVLSGVGYREGDPRAALRNWILRNYTKYKGTSRGAYDMCAMMIRAYNYTVDGTKIVQMRSVDNSGDNWPTISSKKFTA
jgi:hypothetical protein